MDHVATGKIDGGADMPDGASALAAAKAHTQARCYRGAMSQQGSGPHGHEGMPQQLVRLVGYRDPHGRAARDWDRQRAKQEELTPVE